MKDIKHLLPLDIKNSTIVTSKTSNKPDIYIKNLFFNYKIKNQTFYKPISKIINL